MVGDEELPPVLKASVHDVRYFSALLRGVNFLNRATVVVTKSGITITVEESRTLLATAYIFADIFDEYEYHPDDNDLVLPSQNSQNSQQEPIIANAAFEIPLNTLIECLNIFGTAGTATGPSSKYKKWRHADDNSDDDDDRNKSRSGGVAASGRIDQFFSGSEKRTGMRMSYAGAGYPLTLLVAEDASGPTTTCEIATFEAEPHLELPFDSNQMVLKIILKSSWLRDALSELDPSCDKLTFIGNPPPLTGGRAGPSGNHSAATSTKPMLRIHAAGTFGSTEMDYPNDRDVLETFECTQTVSFSYRFAHISRTLRALQSSAKTSLRIDRDGLLSLQFLMPSTKPRGAGNGVAQEAFIEFRCLALDDA